MELLIDGALIWELNATHGVPLEISLSILADHDVFPTWDRLFEAAEKDGARLDRLRERILLAVTDSYERETAEIIHTKMKIWWNLRV